MTHAAQFSPVNICWVAKEKICVHKLDEKETAVHSLWLWLLVGCFIYVLHTALQLFRSCGGFIVAHKKHVSKSQLGLIIAGNYRFTPSLISFCLSGRGLPGS